MQASTTTLNDPNPFYNSQDDAGYLGYHQSYDMDDELKQPLGGNSLMHKASSYSLSDPQAYSLPSIPHSSLRSSELGPDDSASQVAWAKRQQGPKRGLTRKVKLTRGNWVVEHRVPTAVKNSIEPKWSQGE
jgi:chitin synthase